MQEVGFAGRPAVAEAMGVEAALADRRWARGCRCFAICEGAAVAAYGWLSTGPEWIGEARAVFRPPAGDAYLWNCVTLPAHRRRGLFAALIRGVAAGAGARRLWIGGLEGTAENAVVAAGFVPVLDLHVSRAGPLRFLRVSAARGAPEPLVAAARGALDASPVALARRPVH